MKLAQAMSTICFLTTALFTAQPALATDQLDVSIALKTLPLLINKLASPVPVAIIYDPAVPNSKTDAARIKSIFDKGLEAPGDLKINPSLMEIREISNLSAFKIAFLADDLSAADDKVISAAASAAGVLTFCTDIDDVRDAQCVIGVVSRPRVNIYYSPIAAEKAGISFSPVFTLLVKQVGSM